MRKHLLAIAFAVPLAACAGVPAPASTESGAQTERSAAQQAEFYLERIASLDDAGPQLNSVIATNPDAPAQAAAAERAGLPLAGRTVLVKDNIETSELPTTAGSLALEANMTRRDAPLIARLRTAGGVVLGKANLSEWANIRSRNSTSGWSAIGGLVRNPHAIDRNACGSSSGSAAAVAARFAWAAIGTETDGSITCPASVNGVVALKPTVGLVSRTHVVPISHAQDTAGPMARSVADVALLLGAIAGSDPADAVTAEADRHRTEYHSGLADASLEGVRIGVMRNQVGERADVTRLFEQALADLRRAGAVPVEIALDPQSEMYRDEFEVLLYELRTGMDAYLSSLPGTGLPGSLADLVAFNEAQAAVEMRWFGQDLFELALTKTDEAAYRAALENSRRLAGEEGIDRLLREHDVAFLIAPTTGPAWASDLVNGDNFSGGIGMGSLAAIGGHPHLTVPMGQMEGLPVGVSVIGPRWADHAVLKAGAAYERARTAPLAVPTFERWLPPTTP
ncbi:amidase [Erythrobacter sp. QSSC1-22B]|uniref:amidase n=1 Tax=Erythrobacter sp. QSSC1-22B TaxID=1860125 RepID=UPI00080497E7|nr:amidase [Erythrobacter sp. QSSC1-22B]OBX20446.1 amidase [Erythrobacter sp. QSSC1-22B]